MRRAKRQHGLTLSATRIRLPTSARYFRYFPTEAFARPAEFSFGDAGKLVIRGRCTFDLALSR
ncbi:MAG TPA: hypothetical protein VFQ79_15155 [Bryobacteraceae bacterium]|nr:hypothetical protein [Bryobacteraceae bacterium]